jgi:hypothetical protein
MMRATNAVDALGQDRAARAWVRYQPSEAWVARRMRSRSAARAGEIIKERMEETLEHEAGLKLVLDICAPAFAEHPDWTTGQCVNHLAALGDARAIALKNHWQAQMQADEPGRLRPPQQPRTWNVATTAPDTRSARRAAPSRAGGAS